MDKLVFLINAHMGLHVSIYYAIFDINLCEEYHIWIFLFSFNISGWMLELWTSYILYSQFVYIDIFVCKINA